MAKDNLVAGWMRGIAIDGYKANRSFNMRKQFPNLSKIFQFADEAELLARLSSFEDKDNFFSMQKLRRESGKRPTYDFITANNGTSATKFIRTYYQFWRPHLHLSVEEQKDLRREIVNFRKIRSTINYSKSHLASILSKLNYPWENKRGRLYPLSTLLMSDNAYSRKFYDNWAIGWLHAKIKEGYLPRSIQKSMVSFSLSPFDVNEGIYPGLGKSTRWSTCEHPYAFTSVWLRNGGILSLTICIELRKAWVLRSTKGVKVEERKLPCKSKIDELLRTAVGMEWEEFLSEDTIGKKEARDV